MLMMVVDGCWWWLRGGGGFSKRQRNGDGYIWFVANAVLRYCHRNFITFAGSSLLSLNFSYCHQFNRAAAESHKNAAEMKKLLT